MGHTGNIITKDFIRQMSVPVENRAYFGDGDRFNSNPVNTVLLCLVLELQHIKSWN